MGTVLNPTAVISDGNGNTQILPMLGVVQVTPGGTPVGVENPLPVQPPMPVGFIAGQGVISTAGTAVRVYSAGAALSNGLIVTASPANSGTLTVGPSGVTNVTNGNGNGYRLAPGQSMSFAVANANAVWVNGTASGDTFDFVGN